jgi:RNase P subunit RPR2
MESIIVERKYCPDCKAYVQAEVTYLNPDKPDEGMIWQCLQCGCAIEPLDE